MVPESVASLAALLFLVAPGFLYQLLRERRVPDRAKTPFREVSWVVLGSVVFSGGAFVLLSIVRVLWPSVMPDPGAWLDGGSDYVESNYRLVARFVVAQVLLSALLVVLFDWRPVRSGLRWAFAHVPIIGDYVPAEVEEGRIVKRTAWFTSFRQRAETETVYVCVRVDTGTKYYGYVMEYTPGDEPLADRELVLMAPLAVRHPGGTRREALPADWKRMVLHGDGIVAILVSYR